MSSLGGHSPEALKAHTYSLMSQQFAAFNKRLKGIKEQVHENGVELGAVHLVDLPELREQYTRVVGRTISAIMAPDFETAGRIQFRTEFRKQMLPVLLAAAEVRAETGRWPVSLDALNAARGTPIPRDIYSREERDPVRYRLSPQGPTVYGIGLNGRDDQGASDSATMRDDISIGILTK